MSRVSLSLIPLLVFAACGDEKQPAAAAAKPAELKLRDVPTFEPVPRQYQELAADVGKLVPADAMLVTHLRAPQQLIDTVKGHVASVSPGAENLIAAEMALKTFGLRERDVDLQRGATLAISMGPRGEVPVMILPAKDPADAADMAEYPAIASGDYIAIGMQQEPAIGEATPEIAKALVAGDVVTRVDLGAVIEMFRPMIDQTISKEGIASNPIFAQEPGLPEIMEIYAGFVRPLIDEARVLDLSYSVDGDSLDIDMVLTLASEAEAGADTKAARAFGKGLMLPSSDAGMVITMGVEWQAMFDQIMPMYEQLAGMMPEEEGEKFLSMVRGALSLYDGFDSIGYTVDFGPPMGGLLLFDDPGEDFFDRYLKVLRDPAWGGMFSDLEEGTAEVAGLEFRTMGVRFDWAAMMEMSALTPQQREMMEGQLGEMEKMMESMFGADRLQFSMARLGSYMIGTVGDVARAEPLITALQGGDWQAEPMLAEARERLHATPTVFMGMDLRQLMKMVEAMLASQPNVPPMPAIPDGEPIQCWGSYARHGKQVELQMHVDLKSLLSFAQQIILVR